MAKVSKPRRTALRFKTIEGARKRASFENTYAKLEGKPWRFRVVDNDNSWQVANGQLFVIVKEKVS